MSNKPKVHRFGFSRNDLANALRRKSITSWDINVFNIAMDQPSLTAVVEYVVDYS